MALTDAGLTVAGTAGPPTNTPPVIDSAPNPLFTEETAATYDMSQHFTDDGQSTVTTSLTNILPNGFSYDGATHILTYDGIGAASVSQHQLVVDDGVNDPVSSAPFDLTIQEIPESTPATQWLGIPDPSILMGYDPISVTEPADHANWPSAEATGHYYFDPGHASATDTSNTYGYPDKPRSSIPTTLNLAAAGGKAVIVGDGNVYSAADDITVNGTGTASNLNWVVGRYSSTKPNLSGYRCDLTGEFTVWENINLSDWASDGTIIRGQAEKQTIRHSSFGGDGVNHGHSSASNIQNKSCMYDVFLHDFGDWQTATENDYHGFKRSGSSPADIWLLEVSGTRLGGDTIQMGSAGGTRFVGPHRIYIGGGDSHDNKENAVDIKTCYDIVISGVKAHDFVGSPSSSGSGIVIHDLATDVWVIRNDVYRCNQGVSCTGSTQGVRILLNLIHDCQGNNGRAVNVTSGGGITVACNTFWNNKRLRAGAKNMTIIGNIFGPRTDPSNTYDIELGSGDQQGATIDYNVYENIRNRESGTDYTTFAGWRGSGPYDDNGREGDPDFVDVANDDVHIGPLSAALFNGIRPDAITDFETKFGVSIEKDYDQVDRPLTSLDWDVGAYQRTLTYVGFGAATKGADDYPGGPSIYHVTNLNNSGSGSFRDAVSADGRHVVFDVGGTITLTSTLQITKSYLTLDGETAPSPGITLDILGQRLAFEASGGIAVHDNIVNHIRSVGNGVDTEGKDHWELDGGSGAPVYNIVLDHMTMRKSSDGNVDIYANVHDITISNCLTWDSIQGHHFSNAAGTRDAITIYRNVYAKNNERQPRIRYNTTRVEFVNNVIYGWGWKPGGGGVGMTVKVGGSVYSPSANVENNIYHYVSGTVSGDEDDALFVDGTLYGDWYFNGNDWPSGELDGDSVTNSSKITIPAASQVERLATAVLGTDVVPNVGTHFKTAEETTLLSEISAAIG